MCKIVPRRIGLRAVSIRHGAQWRYPRRVKTVVVPFLCEPVAESLVVIGGRARAREDNRWQTDRSRRPAAGRFILWSDKHQRTAGGVDLLGHHSVAGRSDGREIYPDVPVSKAFRQSFSAISG